MLNAAGASIYVGDVLPSGLTPTWHLPAAPIDEIARLILDRTKEGPKPAHDQYTVTSARYLDDAEIRAIDKMRRAPMSTFDDAADALESRDWTGATVVEGPRTPSIVQSVRMTRDLTERLLAEAQRRGVTPSELIREFVEASLSAVDESATVRLADVRRVIDALAARAA